MNIDMTGVYGETEDSFFQKIIDKKITLFIDVRNRRGMRGSKYKFVNSIYLQNKLKELGIQYIHLKGLAPTSKIRQLQKAQDHINNETKQKRTKLSSEFIEEYNKNILSEFDFDHLGKLIAEERALFFCVEAEDDSCHRSLIVEKIRKDFG
ncbi:DUF488 domain-containing protein [Psychrobacter sp. ANT_H59]|uniref:DUF488 domain-containing protein n=1 Tax=Psychrobacter sp. ANT_H59 TaxID=2597354 RepID=UPI0011EC80AE|nr:DUF488 domain-containing protein [Psychrobacter sp. ANT_H59]KAA0939704.1 DUF488 domain-containing protein [Psychrobacter sp. ANT_H59]